MCEGNGNVQIRTGGVHRCHLRQSVSYGLVNWRVRFGLVNLVYKTL